jgi:hypothetical protein
MHLTRRSARSLAGAAVVAVGLAAATIHTDAAGAATASSTAAVAQQVQQRDFAKSIVRALPRPGGFRLR